MIRLDQIWRRGEVKIYNPGKLENWDFLECIRIPENQDSRNPDFQPCVIFLPHSAKNGEESEKMRKSHAVQGIPVTTFDTGFTTFTGFSAQIGEVSVNRPQNTPSLFMFQHKIPQPMILPGASFSQFLIVAEREMTISIQTNCDAQRIPR